MVEVRRAGDAVGPWVLARPLGQGGMGQVWLAHGPDGEEAAIKLLVVTDRIRREAMRAEIRALARLSHPGVVRVLGHGVDQGVPWYAMERIHGPTLGEVGGHGGLSAPTLALGFDELDRTPQPAPERPERTLLPLAEVLATGARLCDALHHVHAEGLVHLDVKADNVLLRPDGTPVLVDFGLASRFSTRTGREDLEVAVAVGGTTTSMAPEQIRGDPVDARADLYAFGCLLYQLLTGSPPFRGAPRDVLRCHLQVAPVPPGERVSGIPPELDDLVLRLLRKAPADRPGRAFEVRCELDRIAGLPPPPAPTERPAPYRPALQGRERELGALVAHLDAATSGRGGVVRVTGPAGIGRTRLLRELGRVAMGRDVTVLLGQASDPGRPLQPLVGPLLQLAERCLEHGAAEVEWVFGPRRGVLATFAPELLGVLGPAPTPAELPPGAALDRTFTALVDTLAAGAGVRGLLLLLDDLHRADPLTRRFFEYLDPSLGGPDPLRRAPLTGRPVLVIGASSAGRLPFGSPPSDASNTESSGSAPRSASSIGPSGDGGWPRAVEPALELGALDDDHLRALAADAGGGPPPPGLVEAARGNPHAAMARLRFGDADLPDLPGEARDVLGALAVAGTATPERLAAMLDLGVDRVRDALRPWLAAEVVVEVGAGVDVASERLAEAAGARLSEDRRRALHRCAAATLPTDDGTAALRARHLDAAGDPSGRELWLVAARRARAQGALDAAADAYRRWLAGAGPGPDTDAVRIELAAEVLRVDGRVEEALRALDQARRSAESRGDRRTAAEALHGLGLAAWTGGRLTEAEASQRAAVAAWEEVGDDEGRARTRGQLGLVLAQAGRSDEAAALFEQVLAEAREQRTRVHALGNLGMLAFRARRFPEALEVWEEALGLAASMGDRRACAALLANVGGALGALGRLDLAEERLTEGLRTAREVGHRVAEAHVLSNLANALVCGGRTDEALAGFAAAAELYRVVGDGTAEAGVRAVRDELLRDLGRAPEARG